MGLVLDAEGMLGTKRSKRYVCLHLPLSSDLFHRTRGPVVMGSSLALDNYLEAAPYAGLRQCTTHDCCAEFIQWCPMLQVQCSD